MLSDFVLHATRVRDSIPVNITATMTRYSVVFEDYYCTMNKINESALTCKGVTYASEPSLYVTGPCSNDSGVIQSIYELI